MCAGFHKSGSLWENLKSPRTLNVEIHFLIQLEFEEIVLASSVQKY